ncbi:hypothetical protein AADJ18_11400, partial [Erwinia amylovora]|uniref:hypothetical protein n=1 Tax=Erwinia amylovora TaxID=552 RepID=UPI0037DDB2D7
MSTLLKRPPPDAGEGHVCLPLAQLRPESFFAGRYPELAQALCQSSGSPAACHR